MDKIRQNVPTWDSIVTRYKRILISEFDINFLINLFVFYFILLYMPLKISLSSELVILLIIFIPVFVCFQSYFNNISEFQLFHIAPIPLYIFVISNITTLNGSVIISVLNAIAVTTVYIITLRTSLQLYR